MDGYTLTNKMRKSRRRHPLTATEQALYHELVAMCNDVEWDDVFHCTNGELCTALSIDEKTLIKCRNTLIQVGLLFYKSGKSRRSPSTYSFVKRLEPKKTTGIIPAVKPANQPANVPVVLAKTTGIIPDIIHKQKETKTKELYVLVGGTEKVFSDLKNLFSVDEGLRRRWMDHGYKHEDFETGIEYFFQRHHGKSYAEFKKLRDHLFNWIPKYSFELKDKKNGTNNHQRCHGNSGGSQAVGRHIEMDEP